MSDGTSLRPTGRKLLLLGGIATLGVAALGLQPASASELVVEAAPLQSWTFHPCDRASTTDDLEGAAARTNVPSSARSGAVRDGQPSDAAPLTPTFVGGTGALPGTPPTATPEVPVENPAGGESHGAVQDATDRDSSTRPSSPGGEATMTQRMPESTPESHTGSRQDEGAEAGPAPVEMDPALSFGSKLG